MKDCEGLHSNVRYSHILKDNYHKLKDNYRNDVYYSRRDVVTAQGKIEGKLPRNDKKARWM